MLAPAIAQTLGEAKLALPASPPQNTTSVIQSVPAAQLVAKTGVLDTGARYSGQAAPAALQVASTPRRP